MSNVSKLAAPQNVTGNGGFDFTDSDVREGMTLLGAHVQIIIFQDEKGIVFLDDNYLLRWACRITRTTAGCVSPEITSRVAVLESAPLQSFSRDEYRAYQALLAQGIARQIGDHDLPMSREALDDAERWLMSRTRLWYLSASASVGALCALFGTLLWVFRSSLQPRIGTGAFDVALGAMVGGVGAFLSTLLRLGDVRLDVFAAPLGIYVNGAAPIVAATIGGALVAGAVKANLVAIAANQSRALLLVMCAVSGTSERLVPSLINKVEVALPVSQDTSLTASVTPTTPPLRAATQHK